MLKQGSVIMDRIMHQFLDALAPLHCVICKLPIQSSSIVHRVCNGCLFMLESAPASDILSNQLYAHDKSDTFLMQVASVFLTYQNAPMQTVLYEIKYNGGKRMANDFGRHMHNMHTSPICDVYIPVPLHSAKRRERGFNQSFELARGLSSVTGIALSDCLNKTSYTQSQTKLNAYQRTTNVMNQFQLNHTSDIRGAHVLLIDDVMTTGSTLESCAFTLLEAGAKTVSGYTLAAATKQRGV